MTETHKIKITCNLCQKNTIVEYDYDEEPFWTDDDAVVSDYTSHYISEHFKKAEIKIGSYQIEVLTA